MIRFIRNLLLLVIVLVIIACAGAWYYTRDIIEMVEGPITDRLVTAFNPDENTEYSYEAGIRILQMVVEITDLNIESDTLGLDGDIYEDARLSVDRIECPLVPLIRYERVEIETAEGRRFQGKLSNEALAARMVRENEGFTELSISEYDGRCRIVGRFGLVGSIPMSIIGEWEINDDGAMTLAKRDYHNPDGPVPPGFAQVFEEQTNLDVVISLLDVELVGDDVQYDGDWLYVSFREEIPEEEE